MQIEEISNDFALNLTDVSTTLTFLESQTNESSNITELEQKVNKLETEDLFSLKKMVRNLLRKSKENHASIEELKAHDHGSESPTSNYSPNNFDVINTLMVTVKDFAFY